MISESPLMQRQSIPLVASGLRRLYELLKELTESDWFSTAFDATTDLAEEVVHNDAFGFMLLGGVLLVGFLVSEGLRHRRERRLATGMPTSEQQGVGRAKSASPHESTPAGQSRCGNQLSWRYWGVFFPLLALSVGPVLTLSGSRDPGDAWFLIRYLHPLIAAWTLLAATVVYGVANTIVGMIRKK